MSNVKIKDSDFFNYSNDNFLMLTSKNVLSNKGINEIVSKINLESKSYALLEQIHSDKIIFAKNSGNKGRADGLITHIENDLILCIMTADCFPIFIYDSKTGFFSLIHAGWRGVVSKIHKNALLEIKKLGSKLEDVNISIGPSIKKCCFEVKNDVVKKFNDKYVIMKNNKLYINLLHNILDDLTLLGIPMKNISFDEVCTYDDDKCCSFRRDGSKSGRMFSLMTYLK
ncbi:MAG: hypothetical protein CMG09_04695 [Candidatus Marinimicrobia bacterium]|nr:hypothetical protein [Candidatus Neomarinimicrobiota bacterium]|tara:strand:- start:1332 stop:2012 length:681 start_codon:yes stop_codon:yes gene_type:complete